jgi:glycosyltransferase involved in cell wall biosynthesis
MGKINIIHVRDSCGVYGAERVILTLAKHIDENRFNFILLALKSNKSNSQEFIDNARQMGINVIVVPTRGRIDLLALIKIRKILKEKNVNILHSHDFKANFYSILASINIGVKRIVTSHGSTRDSLLKKAYLFLDEKISYKYFNKIIAVSEEISSYLKENHASPDKITVIQNGVDFSLLQSNLESDFSTKSYTHFNKNVVISVIGRLFPDKGHRFFLIAFSMVCKKHPSAMALIVGDGPLREELSNQIRKMNLEQNVFLCGARSDMKNVYKQTDFVVIPSLREGLPYVLLEAMACEIPVLATSVGDIPLLIQHEVTGYIVSSGDSKALEKYMIELINNPEKAKEMAVRGKQFVIENFSAKKMVKKVEKLYLSLIENN